MASQPLGSLRAIPRSAKSSNCVMQPNEARSKEFDGQYKIPTFEEILDLAENESVRPIGIDAETKHPAFHGQLSPIVGCNRKVRVCKRLRLVCDGLQFGSFTASASR